MTNKLLVNELPVKTWNFLNVNSAEVNWDSEKTAHMNDDNITVSNSEKYNFEITGQGEYSSKNINVQCRENCSAEIFEIGRAHV